MDWTKLAAVIAAAKKMGSGHVVVKHDNRPNYNITHAERTDLYMKSGVTVLYRS